MIEVTLACPDVAEGNDFGTVILGDRRHGHRIFVNIQTDVDWARLWPG